MVGRGLVGLGLESLQDSGEGVLLVVDECDECVKAHRDRVMDWRNRGVEVVTIS